MSVTETMKAITGCVKKLIEAPRYNVGDFVGVYEYETDVRIHDINEWNLPEGYIFKDENGNVINATKIVLEKKKKEYPNTYDECAVIMGVGLRNCLWGEDATEYEEQTEDLMDAFIKLKICRDAYWKIAGEEMGLGKPWKPDWLDDSKIKYGLRVCRDSIQVYDSALWRILLAFPTEKMRDAFKENFDPDIEFCKELL